MSLYTYAQAYEDILDKLHIIHKAEDEGGAARREAIEDVLITARKLGCDLNLGGGQAGGFNIRYGAIGYALMDLDTHGTVKLYVQPHPGKEAPRALIDALNRFIDRHDALQPKSSPLHSYGHLEAPIEAIPAEALSDYLQEAMRLIYETYYRPHFERELATPAPD